MRPEQKLVLAVFPSANGVGFVLFEGPDFIVDWGTVGIRPEHRVSTCSRWIGRTLQYYKPDVLVYRAMGAEDEVLRRLLELSLENGVPGVAISRDEVRRAFSTSKAVNRHTIAAAIVLRFPHLSSFDPGRRKLWMGEDRRMGVFNAAGLGLAFFATRTDNLNLSELT